MKNVCVACYFTIWIVFMRNVVPQPIDRDIEMDEEECNNEMDGEYEYGDFFEGDMDLNDDQLAEIYGDRSVLKEEKYRWPHAKIPYLISEDYSFEQKRTILWALDEIQKVSCAKFVPRSNESDHIHVVARDSRCYSKVGRQGGKQYLNLGKSEPGTKCFRRGTIMHELLHALGFTHMQSVLNRGKYIKVNMRNIEKGKEHNFQTYNASFVTNFNMEYDFGSIMHYHSQAFSKDKTSPTIEPRNEDPNIENLMGQRNGLSRMDILKINKMYNCKTQKAEAAAAKNDHSGCDRHLPFQHLRQIYLLFLLILHVCFQ